LGRRRSRRCGMWDQDRQSVTEGATRPVAHHLS
jgi:hypothetical protein